jgi:hypothetical protein
MKAELKAIRAALTVMMPSSSGLADLEAKLRRIEDVLLAPLSGNRRHHLIPSPTSPGATQRVPSHPSGQGSGADERSRHPRPRTHRAPTVPQAPARGRHILRLRKRMAPSQASWQP